MQERMPQKIREEVNRLAEPSYVSRRPVKRVPKIREPKLYSVVYSNGTNFLVFIIQRTSRFQVQSFVEKHVKRCPGYSIHGINVVDKSRLDSGDIVSII